MAEKRLTHTITVDLAKETWSSRPVLVQNSDNTFLITVLNDGEPADLSDVRDIVLAVIPSRKKANDSVYSPGVKVGSTSQVKIDLGRAAVATPGIVQAQLKLTGINGGLISSTSFNFEVQMDAGLNFQPSENELTLIETVLGDGPTVLANATQTIADMESTQATLTGAVGGAISSLNEDKAAAIEELDTAKTTAVNELAEVREANRFRQLDAVATVADRDTTYPTPEHGDTVRVTSTATMYRYVDGTGWVVSDRYEATAVDALNQQLAEKVSKGNVSISDINKNSGKFDQTFLTDELLQQIAGEAPVNAVTAPLSQTTQKFANKSITPSKTTFIRQSSNIFNKNDVVIGKVIGYDGLITDNASYGYSHLIEVTPGQSIYTSGVYHVVLYDADADFRQRVNATISGGAITIPEGCYYVRVNFNPTSTQWKNGTIKVNNGDVALPYEDFYSSTEGVLIGANSVNNESIVNGSIDANEKISIRSITDELLKKNSLSPSRLKFIKMSTNLLDKDKESKGILMGIDGISNSNPDYNTSDFIEVTPSQTISTKGFYYILNYDKNKNFIGRTSITADEYANKQIVLSENTYYIRGSYPNKTSLAAEAQINYGDTLLPYEPYYAEVNDVILSDKIKNDYLFEINDPNKRVVLDMPIDGIYRTQSNMLAKWNYSAATTSAEVYAKFDELMAQHPDYITKEFLGNDDFGNPISLYKFSQARPTSVGNKRIPTVYLTAGVHGSEIIPPFGTWLMFDEICNNWQSDPLLEALRFNVNFLIIPVAVPTGFEDLTRWNRNGVDVNRNFNTPDWVLGDPTSGSYGGTEPMSEAEARIIASVYEVYPNIDIMYDLHNFGTNPDNHMLWVRTEGGERSWYIGENLITLMTREWRKTYDFIPDDLNTYIGWVNAGGQATVGHYAKTKGIPLPGTLEVANQILLDPNATGIDENLMKTTVEAYVNWILMNLRELVSNNKTFL